MSQHTNQSPHHSFVPAARIAMSFIACAIIACGCASRHERVSNENSRRADDASFASGAGRAPTASTSYSFARILVGQGRDRDAEYVLSRNIREHPTFVPSYNELAGIYMRSDRLDDAIDVLQAGLKKSPQDTVLQNNLGMCYLLAGHNDEALTYFSRATERMPSNPVYRANRATALAMLGREADAAAEYRGVLTRSETQANLAILAKARTQQGNEAHSSTSADE